MKVAVPTHNRLLINHKDYTDACKSTWTWECTKEFEEYLPTGPNIWAIIPFGVTTDWLTGEEVHSHSWACWGIMADCHSIHEFLRVIVLILLMGVKLDRATLKDDLKVIDYIWRDLSSYNTGHYLFWRWKSTKENEGRHGVVGPIEEKGYSFLRLSRFPN